MKISYSWLKEYIDLDQTPQETSDLLTNTGLEVTSLDKFQPLEGGLEGVVVGKVVSCEKHPNADKLWLTQVELGNSNPAQIICGAPNVAEGQKVLVATVGTTLHPFQGDPFRIKKAKIRGVESEGMICAEDELGLGSGHKGVMVLDTKLPNGTPASEYLGLEEDFVYEIDLTPNRADATSHIGVARDLKAVLDREVKFHSIKEFKVDNNSLPISVKVENTDACPRYSGVTISGVTIKESPQWLQYRLRSIGLSPINNVVDATNFVLHGCGQPLHAFDADEIAGGQIIVKTLPKGSTFTPLDEKERKLNDFDLMICNGKESMCIAGVFGGVKSGVKDETRNIFLESAYFSPDYIRKTAQFHGLKTDASFRFERGTDPELTVYALKRAIILIKELAGGEVTSEIVDVYPKPIKPIETTLKFKNINRLIGKTLDHKKIFKILSRLDIEVKERNKDGFKVSIPPYRVDVQREADVIEEILRIYGYNQIDISSHLKSDFLAEFPEVDEDKLQSRVSEHLASTGFHEIFTNSLTKPEYADLLDELDSKQSVTILNKLSEELGVLRQSLLFSGLEVVAHNVNRKQKDLNLFEFGTSYRALKPSGHQVEDYEETRHLCLFMTGNRDFETWNQPAKPVSFYDLSQVINNVLQKFNARFETTIISDSLFEFGMQYNHGEQVLVSFGKVSSSLTKKMQINQDVYYADFDWVNFLGQWTSNKVIEEIPRFPEVRRDLSLVLDKRVVFKEIQHIIERKEFDLVKKINVFDVFEGKNIGENKKAYALSFILQDSTKTLTDKVIDRTMNRLMSCFESELGALIRK